MAFIYVVGSFGTLDENYYDMWIAFKSKVDADRICEQWNNEDYTRECEDYRPSFKTLVAEKSVFTVQELEVQGIDVEDIDSTTPLVMTDEVEQNEVVYYQACRPATDADASVFYVDDYRIYGEGLVNGLAVEDELD